MRKLKTSNNDMQERLLAMPSEARDHFMHLVDLLLMCYADPPQASAVLLVEPSEGGTLVIASANACDMTAAELVAEAQQIMKGVLVADAPPKELFN